MLSDKLADIANVAAGGMIFGQFLTDVRFSPALAAGGIIVWVALTAAALTTAPEDKP